MSCRVGRAGLSCLDSLSSRQHRGCRSYATARWSVTRSAVLSTKSRFASRFLAYRLFYMTRCLIMIEKCRVASANSMIVPLTFRCRPEQWRDCLCGGRCGALLRPQRGIPADAAGAARAEAEKGSPLLLGSQRLPRHRHRLSRLTPPYSLLRSLTFVRQKPLPGGSSDASAFPPLLQVAA